MKFEGSLGYLKPCLKNKNKTKIRKKRGGWREEMKEKPEMSICWQQGWPWVS